MIRYHGGPITPQRAGYEAWKARHAMVSYAHNWCISLAAESAQSFVLDNGAFSAWKSGTPLDVSGYIRFVDEWRLHPGFDWCIIPDVIEGDENENDAMLADWPYPSWMSVPVWHLHESIDRLVRLASEWPRVAIGSSGEWATPGTDAWWDRMGDALDEVTDQQGRPVVKLHGLRMLDPRIYSLIPFASVDSCSVARNLGIDKKWDTGYLRGLSRPVRAAVLADRFENHAAASTWERTRERMGEGLFG